MRYLTLILICASPAVASPRAQAPVGSIDSQISIDTTTARPHRVSLDFFAAWLGNYIVRYEYELLPYLTLTTPLQIQSWAFAPWPVLLRDNLKNTFNLADLMINTGVGAKFHWKGWYVNPLMKIGYAKFEYRGRAGTRHMAVLEPGLYFGYQWNSQDGFYLDVGAGLNARFYRPKNARDVTAQLEIITAMGYAF